MTDVPLRGKCWIAVIWRKQKDNDIGKDRVITMKQILSYIVAAMILSVSSIALIAALLAQDVFGRPDSYVALVFVLLSILYFTFLLLLDRYRLLRAKLQ